MRVVVFPTAFYFLFSPRSSFLNTVHPRYIYCSQVVEVLISKSAIVILSLTPYFSYCFFNFPKIVGPCPCPKTKVIRHLPLTCLFPFRIVAFSSITAPIEYIL